MSDATQGPGWWQASDGKWYPPEQHPDLGNPTQPVESVSPTEAVPPSTPPPAPVPPTQAMAPVPPPVPPGPPGGPPPGPVPGGPPPGNNRGKVIAIVAIIAAIVIVAALLLANRDSGDTKVAASDSDKSATEQTDATDATDATDSSASTDKTTTTKKTTTTTSKATTTTAASGTITQAQLEKLLLTPSEMGDGLQSTDFPIDSTKPEACGQPNTDIAFPPDLVAAAAAQQPNVHVVSEQVRTYADATTSSKAFDASVQGISCSQGNAFGSDGKPVPITIGPIQDVTGQVTGAKRAIAATVTGKDFDGLVIGVDLGGAVAAFQFEAAAGAGTETFEARLPVAQAGVNKLLAG